MVTAPTLIQQLHGKVDELRRMSDQLRQGEFLRPVIAQANDQSVWIRGPQIAFCGWIQALDAWMRNQFVGALDVVRQKLESYVRDFDNAQQAFANGIPGVALPPPPPPVGLTPPNCPYPFQMQVPKGTNPNMNADLMRKGLANAIGRAKEELHGFSIRLGDILTEPAPVPGAPVVPGAPPMRHLPPDAKEAAGIPKAYEAIGIELEKALRDVLERADAWEKVVEDELPTSTPDLSGAVAGLGASSGAAVAGSQDAVTGVTAVPTTPAAEAPAPVPTQPEKPPPTPEQVATAREEGTKLAEEALKKDVLKNPEELKKTAEELAAHKGDPAAEAYAAAFVERFGAKNMMAIPRALHSLQTGVPMDPQQSAFELHGKPPPTAKKEDIEGILYAFSATLATATQYDDFNQDVEDKILATDDRLALSWLLANPHADFDVDFLVEAFETGVKDQLIDEAALTGIGAYGGKTKSPLELTGIKLDTDPKVVVLDAISRNEAAAMRIADMEFKPPLTISMGLRPSVKVHNVVELLYTGGATANGYGDKGAAVGRMLDSAHQGFCKSGDAGNARELVDRILKGATDDKDVAEAQGYLRQIGLRQPLTPEEADKALADVRKDPEHPAREALLAMASQSEKAALDFARTAAEAAGKSKVDPEKVPELKSLFETDGAWDNIATVRRTGTPEQQEMARTVTEDVIARVAKGEDLTDSARLGLARTITADVHAFALSSKSASSQAPEVAGIRVGSDDLVKVMADLMKDPEARKTLELGAGNLTASWAARSADQELERLLGRPADEIASNELVVQGNALGKYLCTMLEGVGKQAEDKAQAAIDAMAGMRIGGDLLMMGVDFAASFVPGAGTLTKAGAFLLEQGVDKVKKGLEVDGGTPELLNEGLEGVIKDSAKSGKEGAIVAAQSDVKSTNETVDNLVFDTMAQSFLSRTLARPPEERDQLLAKLGVRASVDGQRVEGLAALQALNLLDKEGRLAIPPTNSPAYTSYRNWLDGDGTAFQGAVTKSTLSTSGPMISLTHCMSKHLQVKTTAGDKK